MTNKYDGLAIMNLRYDGDDSLREIAKILRRGDAEPDFLRMLADQIDPDKRQTLTGTKLVISRTKDHRPKARPKYDLRNFIYVHRFGFAENLDAVVAAAMAKFACSRSTVMRDVGVMNTYWGKRTAEEQAEHKELCRLSRAEGLVEYAPLH